MSVNTATITKCFQGLIALDGQCGEAIPSSGIFTKKLGVTRSEMASYLTQEYATVDDLFKDKMEAATLGVCNKVYNLFAPRYKQFSVLENSRAGLFMNNLELIAGETGRMKGIQFTLTNRSSFLDLLLPSIALQLNHEGEINLQLIDLIQGKLINTIKVPVLPNEIISMSINEIIPSDRKYLNAFIGYDSTGISANKTLLQPIGTCCGGTSLIENSYMRIRSASIGVSQQKIDSNIKAESDTGGLSVMYSLSCNHKDWICSISQRLALAIAYQTNAEIMEHAKYQGGKDQMNIRVGNKTSKEELEERRIIYERKCSSEIKNVIANISTPSDRLCFVCKQNNRMAFVTP